LELAVKPAVKLIVVIALLLIVAATLRFPQRMLSPGNPSAGHAAMANDCFACHRSWRGAQNRKCTACHRPDQIGLATTTGKLIAAKNIQHAFHQELIEQNCMACHVIHLGTTYARRSQQQFAHTLLRPTVRQRCELCHLGPRDDLHQAIRSGCADCHNIQHWIPASFAHDAYFVLEGEHNVKCSICHAAGNFRSYSCYGCHEHDPERIRAEHAEEGVRNIDECAACHRSASEESESD
jgi:hypothetical protein